MNKDSKNAMNKALFSIGALAFMCACSIDEPGTGSANPANAISVTSEVSTPSRAGYTSETLREFGLFVIGDELVYNNKKMSGGPIEGWSTDETMYWTSPSSSHIVLAYAPYIDAPLDGKSKIDISVRNDQSTEEGVKASDFIAMKKAAYIPQNDMVGGKLLVKMDHMFTKVFVELSYPEIYASAATNPVADFGVSGMVTEATIDFGAWDGTVSTVALNGNSEKAEITPYELSHDADNRVVTYEFIAVPQEVAQIGVSFKAGGIPYSWKYDNLKMEAGKAITIRLSIDKTGVNLGSATVGEWTTGDDINGGNPGGNPEAYTVEEIVDGKSQWSIEYGTASMPFGPYSQLFNNNNGDGWFSQVVDGYAGSSNTGKPYCVVDLGEKVWLSGVGCATANHDVMPKAVDFYITKKELVENVITADELSRILCESEPNGDALVKSDEYKNEYLPKIAAADAEMEWIHVGKVEIGALSADWGLKNYYIDFDEEKLAEKLVGRWLKVEMTFFSAEEHAVLGGDRARIAEIFVKKVAKVQGKAVRL